MDIVLSLQSRGCWFDTRLVHALCLRNKGKPPIGFNISFRQKYFYSQNGDMHGVTILFDRCSTIFCTTNVCAMLNFINSRIQ